MSTMFLIHFRRRFFGAAWMLAEGSQTNVGGRLPEELGHLSWRLLGESFVPILGRQDDHHAAPRAGHLVGQIIAGDFLLDLFARHAPRARPPSLC